MKLIIDIDEESRAAITRVGLLRIPDAQIKEIDKAIQSGTPLPKRHGRLIDAEVMKTMKSIQSANFNAVELIRVWIDKQPTIIEADK